MSKGQGGLPPRLAAATTARSPPKLRLAQLYDAWRATSDDAAGVNLAEIDLHDLDQNSM
jgi:hypothetical protein